MKNATHQIDLEETLKSVKSPYSLTSSLEQIASGDPEAIIKTRYHFDLELKELRSLIRSLTDLAIDPPDGNLTAGEVAGIASAAGVYADLVSVHISAFLQALDAKKLES